MTWQLIIDREPENDGRKFYHDYQVDASESQVRPDMRMIMK